MKPKPPQSIRILKPTFGIGILVGVGLVMVAFGSGGGDNVLGAVIGGGAGIALGLTQLTRKGLPSSDASGREDGK